MYWLNLLKTSFGLALPFAALTLVACGEELESASTSSVFVPKSGLSYTEPNLVSDCLNNSSYNLCVVWKNPVAQRGSKYHQAFTTNTNVSPFQRHAVNLTEYDGSGTLKNGYVIPYVLMEDSSAVQATTSSGQFKIKYEDDTQGFLLPMLTSYYYLNLQKAVMVAETGAFYADAQAIEVYSSYHSAHEGNAFWSSAANAVVLGNLFNFETAMQAEVALHEMGHANLDFGSSGATDAASMDTSKNVACTSSGLCCSTVNGCTGALHEGIADFHALIMFPLNAVVGETAQNDTRGLRGCKLYRNYDELAEKVASDFYDDCAAYGASGEIHSMGFLYASIWHEVRNKYLPVGSTGYNEINQLFTEHLQSLDGADDFLTAYDKIKAVDTALFSSAYASAFKAEYNRRGLTVSD